MPQENFRYRYENYHKCKLNNDQWNLLLYILNKQKLAEKIKHILQSREFHEHIIVNKDFPIEKIFKGLAIRWEKSMIDSKILMMKNEVETRINVLHKELEENNYSTFISEKNQRKIVEKISQYKRTPDDNREFYQLDESERQKLIEDLDPLLKKQITSRVLNSFTLISTNRSQNSKQHDLIDHINNNKEGYN